jgi:AcrR family transcriptional regulator
LQTGAEQHALKRRALLKEAGRAFARRGFHNTSLDDVARALRVTKPALYRYVKSKHEILYECHKIALEIADKARDYALSEGRTGLEKIQLLMRRHIELLTSELGSCAVLSDMNALLPAQQKQIRARQRKVNELLVALVHEGVRDGSLSPRDPKLMVFFVTGAMLHIPRWFSPDGARSGAEIAAEFVTFITHGLAACEARKGETARPALTTLGE